VRIQEGWKRELVDGGRQADGREQQGALHRPTERSTEKLLTPTDRLANNNNNSIDAREREVSSRSSPKRGVWIGTSSEPYMYPDNYDGNSNPKMSENVRKW
jgi:hypothetical protein